MDLMAKYLAVFTTFTRVGLGACNMEVDLTGAPTIETVRELEASVREQTNASTAVLTNLIPLGSE